jgi:hypothetical protein
MVKEKPRRRRGKPANSNYEAIGETIARECVEKLNNLMKEYGIVEGDYLSLALRLAIDHVPHFRPPRFKLQHKTWGAVVRDTKGGRPIQWTAEQLDALVVEVDTVKKKYNLSTDEAALRHITKSGKWARLANRDPDKWIKTLKNLIAARRKIQRGADELFARLEEIERADPNPEN